MAKSLVFFCIQSKAGFRKEGVSTNSLNRRSYRGVADGLCSRRLASCVVGDGCLLNRLTEDIRSDYCLFVPATIFIENDDFANSQILCLFFDLWPIAYDKKDGI